MKKKEKRKESASSINYEILLRKKRVERDLEENISPFLVESKTVLTFALRGPATSSPGTMHANYQAAIMIRSCRRADEGTSWLLYTYTHARVEERKMEVCWSVTRVVALKKEEKMAQLPAR